MDYVSSSIRNKFMAIQRASFNCVATSSPLMLIIIPPYSVSPSTANLRNQSANV